MAHVKCTHQGKWALLIYLHYSQWARLRVHSTQPGNQKEKAGSDLKIRLLSFKKFSLQIFFLRQVSCNVCWPQTPFGDQDNPKFLILLTPLLVCSGIAVLRVKPRASCILSKHFINWPEFLAQVLVHWDRILFCSPALASQVLKL